MSMIYADVVKIGLVIDATIMLALAHVFVIAVEVLQIPNVVFVSSMPILNMKVLVAAPMIGLENFVIVM